MTASLRIEPIASFEAIRTEWASLAEATGSAFGTPEWLEAWWRHHGGERVLLLQACRGEAGDLKAVLPLYVWREHPRVIRFLGHGPGDELGPVVSSDRTAEAARALRQVLAAHPWDVFLGEQLPGEHDWPELLEMLPWRREASPTLTTPAGGWEAYLRGRSPNFRQQLTRRENTLKAAGAFAFRLADADTLERDLDSLFALHRKRWKGVETAFADTAFHREVARDAQTLGRLRLWLLDLDGDPAAAWLGFHLGGVTSYYQAGRDPSFDAFSVGRVLLIHTIRSAMSEGASEYRFGRGGEDFKYRFTSENPGLVSVAASNTLVGRGALLGARLARSIRNGTRDVRRRSGASETRLAPSA